MRAPACPARLPQTTAAAPARQPAARPPAARTQVLPLGASKGEGVSWLLAELGRDPAHLMALGDGGGRLAASRGLGGGRLAAAVCLWGGGRGCLERRLER